MTSEPRQDVALVERFKQRVQEAKRPAKRRNLLSATGGFKSEFDDELRLVMYVLGAVVGAGILSRASRGKRLQTVASFLDVSARAKKEIDEALSEAPSTEQGLAALFAAYGERKKSGRSIRHPSRTEQNEQAREHLFRLSMLDSTDVSKFLGSRSKNARQYAATLRRRGAILGLPRGNRYVYPEFQFDQAKQQVRPVIEEVGKILDAGTDPWGAVSWWVSPNPRLQNGRAPKDLLDSSEAKGLPNLARAIVDDIG